MTSIIRPILNSLLTLAGAALLIVAIVYGLGLQDKADCMKWAQQADAYPAFYLTSDQKQQCDYWGIPVNARVIHVDQVEQKP